MTHGAHLRYRKPVSRDDHRFAGFDTVYGHFAWGDAYTLHELRARFVNGPVDWAAVAAREKTKQATKTVTGKQR